MELTRTNTMLVLDSTSDLSPELRADPNIRVVPLMVQFGNESLRDWEEIHPEQFYPRLRETSKLPTTSQPSAGQFLQVYQEARKDFERVYSIHISGGLSGTVGSATTAAEDVPGVVPIDSGSASVGLALLADRLLLMLDEGVEEEIFLDYIQGYSERVGFLFMVDTLEYLQKGGRIGRASRIAGSLLSVKPLLTMRQGEVDLYKKVRGERKALSAVQGYFLERTTPDKPVFLAIAHAAAPGKAEAMLEVLRETDRTLDIRVRGHLGSVIGTYVGPGAIGLFFIQE